MAPSLLMAVLQAASSETNTDEPTTVPSATTLPPQLPAPESPVATTPRLSGLRGVPRPSGPGVSTQPSMSSQGSGGAGGSDPATASVESTGPQPGLQTRASFSTLSDGDPASAEWAPLRRVRSSVGSQGYTAAEAFSEAGTYTLALKYTARVAEALTELETVEADIAHCVDQILLLRRRVGGAGAVSANDHHVHVLSNSVHLRGGHAKDVASAKLHQLQTLREQIDDLRLQKVALHRSSAAIVEQTQQLGVHSDKLKFRISEVNHNLHHVETMLKQTKTVGQRRVRVLQRYYSGIQSKESFEEQLDRCWAMASKPLEVSVAEIKAHAQQLRRDRATSRWQWAIRRVVEQNRQKLLQHYKNIMTEISVGLNQSQVELGIKPWYLVAVLEQQLEEVCSETARVTELTSRSTALRRRLEEVQGQVEKAQSGELNVQTRKGRPVEDLVEEVECKAREVEASRQRVATEYAATAALRSQLWQGVLELHADLFGQDSAGASSPTASQVHNRFLEVIAWVTDVVGPGGLAKAGATGHRGHILDTVRASTHTGGGKRTSVQARVEMGLDIHAILPTAQGAWRTRFAKLRPKDVLGLRESLAQAARLRSLPGSVTCAPGAFAGPVPSGPTASAVGRMSKRSINALRSRRTSISQLPEPLQHLGEEALLSGSVKPHTGLFSLLSTLSRDLAAEVDARRTAAARSPLDPRAPGT